MFPASWPAECRRPGANFSGGSDLHPRGPQWDAGGWASACARLRAAARNVGKSPNASCFGPQVERQARLHGSDAPADRIADAARGTCPKRAHGGAQVAGQRVRGANGRATCLTAPREGTPCGRSCWQRRCRWALRRAPMDRGSSNTGPRKHSSIRRRRCRNLDVGSANYIAAGCRDFIARRAVNAYAQGLCAGKVESVAIFAACAPPEATVGQMIRVVVRYIDERPARLHENFIVLAREAFQQAWPCRR